MWFRGEDGIKSKSKSRSRTGRLPRELDWLRPMATAATLIAGSSAHAIGGALFQRLVRQSHALLAGFFPNGCDLIRSWDGWFAHRRNADFGQSPLERLRPG